MLASIFTPSRVTSAVAPPVAEMLMVFCVGVSESLCEMMVGEVCVTFTKPAST